MAVCARCNAQIPETFAACPSCGTAVSPFGQHAPGKPINPFSDAAARPPYGQLGPYAPGQYPAAGPYPAYPPGQDPSYHGLIPYKNSYALIAYYTGILAMFPCVPVLGIAATVLGVMGLRAYKRDPNIKGAVHAWIGIVLGVGTTLLYGAITILFVVMMFVAPQPRGFR